MIENRRLIKLKSTYALAIRANMEDKYRQGDLVVLPKEGDVVVMGDLHGNLKNFNKVVSAIDLASHPNRHLILQEPTHTYEAQEDRSFLLIDEIVFLKSQYPHQVHIILGNHELSEITGKEILKGGICYNILFLEGMKKEYGQEFDAIRELMLDFMKTMPLACIAPNKIFICHSTPLKKYVHHYSLSFFRQGTGNKEKDKAMVEKLVWGRDLSQQAADEFATRVGCDILIVGHTACKRGYQVPNTRHIILDSKGNFAATLHFKLHRSYTQKYLIKNCIQYIHKKAVEKILDGKKDEKANLMENISHEED